MKRATAALVAVFAVGSVALVGCSSSSTLAESAAATSAAAEQEGTTRMLPPVIITENQTEATAKVGNNLDIVIAADKLAGTTVDTPNPDLVELTQARQDGDALFNPGGKVLAPGTATIVVTNPDNTTRTITLTITE